MRHDCEKVRLCAPVCRRSSQRGGGAVLAWMNQLDIYATCRLHQIVTILHILHTDHVPPMFATICTINVDLHVWHAAVPYMQEGA